VSKTSKVLFVILFILVLVSLGLNGFLLWQLQQARQQAQGVVRTVGPQIQEVLEQTIADLETFQESTIAFDVQVNENFPVEVDIPFKETIEVPIQLTVPIQEEINTTILIDPLKTGQGIPVDVTVPVDLEIPIDTTIPVSIDRTIPISTSVPLDLDVPIAIELGDTELADYIERLRDSLASFGPALEQALSEMEP
jgi:hypothetical protein